MIKHTVPAGTYILGDNCYTFPQVNWPDFCDLLHEESDGYSAMGNIDGVFFLTYATAYGDGGYLGSDGFEYSVDAGLIGLTQATPEVLSAYNARPDLGTLVTFTEPTECSRTDEGVLTFGHVVIDTDPEENDEDWFEDPLSDPWDNEENI